MESKMKVNIKNIEISNAIKSIDDMLNLDLPVKVSWDMARNAKT